MEKDINIDKFYAWLSSVREASECAINGELLLPTRRRWDRKLLELTTPAKCLAAAVFIEMWMPKAELEHKMQEIKNTYK